jgi:hypothetical protein
MKIQSNKISLSTNILCASFPSYDIIIFCCKIINMKTVLSSNSFETTEGLLQNLVLASRNYEYCQKEYHHGDRPNFWGGRDTRNS